MSLENSRIIKRAIHRIAPTISHYSPHCSVGITETLAGWPGVDFAEQLTDRVSVVMLSTSANDRENRVVMKNCCCCCQTRELSRLR